MLVKYFNKELSAMKLNHPSHSRRRKVFRIIGIVMSIMASVIWFATVAVLFLRWGLDHFIRYDSDDGQVVYISNVSAKYKWGFILGTVATGISYVLTVLFVKLFYDSVVRQRFRQIASLLSFFCSFISSLSLILLSILDSIHYKRAHYTFVGLFIVFALLSGVLYIIYRFKTNKINWILGIYSLIIGMFIPLIITFIVFGTIGGRSDRSNLKSVAASIEWSLALLFALYLILFAFDLLFYN
jgi:hypothetical protein